MAAEYVASFAAAILTKGTRQILLPSGSYTRDVAFMYRLVEGRIAERWAVRDDLGLMLQLGALTPE